MRPATTVAARTVADAMITNVKVSDRRTTVGELRRLFDDEHVHAAVIVEDGVLLTVVEREDLHGSPRDGAVAVHLGGRESRTVAPDVDLDEARHRMLATGRRRLAVVARDGTFRGLLCLKRNRTGFCSDRDVQARKALGIGSAAVLE